MTSRTKSRSRAKSRSPRGACLGITALVAVLVFTAFMVTIIVTVGIWPGEAKLTAPLFCPDDKPDAFVVVDSYSVQPGETSYNFSLYCMGSRGQVDEIGFFQPAAVLTVGHAALIVVLVGLPILLGRRRRRTTRSVRPQREAPRDAPPRDAPPQDAPPQDAPP